MKQLFLLRSKEFPLDPSTHLADFRPATRRRVWFPGTHFASCFGSEAAPARTLLKANARLRSFSCDPRHRLATTTARFCTNVNGRRLSRFLLPLPLPAPIYWSPSALSGSVRLTSTIWSCCLGSTSLSTRDSWGSSDQTSQCSEGHQPSPR